MTRLRILLDLDEVLADFVGGAARLFGVELAQLREQWPIGKWDIVPPLARALGQPLTPSDFWARINGSAEFWRGLDRLPWADEVLQLIQSYTDDWHIISSPSSCPSCYAGKVEWLKLHFGPTFNQFAITPHKHIFATPEALLIDDSDANVQRFREHGGRAVVFPAYHNTMHEFTDDPIGCIKAQLARRI